MTHRRMLYGYQVLNGELAVMEQEAVTVKSVVTLYLDGLSYLKIAGHLNSEGIPYSQESPLWDKHKVKRLLENRRYAGADGYPAIIDAEDFQRVQAQIMSKATERSRPNARPALKLLPYLRCGLCGKPFRRVQDNGKIRTENALRLKCQGCGNPVIIADKDLTEQVERQMEQRNRCGEDAYAPSGEVIRLANAIDRALENPESPEEAVSLILQGISARYDCCQDPAQTKQANSRPEPDWSRPERLITHITLSQGNVATVCFPSKG